MSLQTSQRAIKKILISQANPQHTNCPYIGLKKRYGLTIDFKPFIQTVPIAPPQFRKFKKTILSNTAILFTSKIAIDHFFRLTKDTRIQLAEGIKYFCTTDPLVHYLQKYIAIKKRNAFSGGKHLTDFFRLIKKHKEERFLFPCSNVSRKDIPKFFKDQGYRYNQIVIYNVVAQDLSSLDEVSYDMIVFFSPLGVKAFTDHFPNFVPDHIKIATFGLQTAKAVEKAGWRSDLKAPQQHATSMADALDLYLKTAS